MITQTQLANLKIQANAALGDSDILKKLIAEDAESAEYQKAIQGQQYYKKDHDIKDHDFRTMTVLDADPNNPDATIQSVFTNPNRSNYKLQHKFLFNHIEQKVSYIAGREPSITVDNAKANEDGNSGNEQWQLQNELAKTTNAKFRKVLLSWLRKASFSGKCWLHEYKDKDGKLKQAVIPRMEGIAIYDTQFEQDIVQFIRHYKVQANLANREIYLTKAEWWTPNGVTYWTEDGNGVFVLDNDYPINPSPHYWEVTYVNGDDGVTPVEKSRVGKSWGKVPFIELGNNSDKLTDLDQYKDLIDAYDLVVSKGTNNLMDFNEFYALVEGYGGEIASAIIKKLEINRAVQVNSTGGKLDLKQLSLDMQGRINWMKELWDSIHFFGCAVDTNADRIGSAPSGVSLEFQYTLLDLKANNMITEAELALLEHFWFVTEDINRREKAKYNPDEISIQFNKSKITNKLEAVQMIVQSENLVPEKILLQSHPLVKDSDQAYKDLLEERKEKIKQQREEFGNFGNVNNEGDEGDGEEE